MVAVFLKYTRGTAMSIQSPCQSVCFNLVSQYNCKRGIRDNNNLDYKQISTFKKSLRYVCMCKLGTFLIFVGSRAKVQMEAKSDVCILSS